MDEHLQNIDGRLYTKRIPVELIKYALDYQPRVGDRIMLTFPRCGTWWTAYAVLFIMNSGADTVLNKIRHKDYKLEFSRERLEARDGTEGPVFMFTHILYKSLAYKSDAKYLMVLRNPKDVCVSAYYQWKQNLGIDMDFHDYFSAWITGTNQPFGGYFEMGLRYWQHRDDSNCTVITYEEMLANPRDAIVKIAAFLGKTYVDRLFERTGRYECFLDHVIQKTSFVAMKGSQHSIVYYFRKGVSGDWRSHLTQHESHLVDEKVRDVWRGTGLEKLWEREMKWESNKS